MTDEADEDERSFLIGDGECMVLDASYLDPENEAEGVLAVQFAMDRGLWVLYGLMEAGEYRQEWRAIAPERVGKKPARVQ